MSEFDYKKYLKEGRLFEKNKDERIENKSISGTYEVIKKFHDGFKNYFYPGDKISIDYEVTFPNRKDKKYEHYVIYYMPSQGDNLPMEIWNAGEQENYDSVMTNLKNISDKTDSSPDNRHYGKLKNNYWS